MLDLEQYKETARRAYYWTSFRPDERGDRDIKELKSHLEEVHNEIYASLLEDTKKDSLYKWYEEKLIKLRIASWGAESRCLSSAITGPAKFPVRKAETARNRANDRADELFQHWNLDISKLIDKNLPEEVKKNNANEADIKDIDERIAFILNPVVGDYTYDIANFKSLLQSKIERLINNKKFETVEYALSKCQENKIFTPRNKIFKIFEDAKLKDTLPKEEKTKSEYEINDVLVRENKEVDRFQIIFDNKPSQEIINELKYKGWRWSPYNKAWQRKLTEQAKYSAKCILEKIK